MSTKRTTVALICAGLILAGISIAGDKTGQWTQWGGPTQNFQAPSSGLAKKWPEAGPPKKWSRDLGEGYSGILYENGRLYTMYRADEKEIVVALDAKSGETIWEHAYDSSPHEGHVDRFGRGPRSTPLLTGGRLYTIGVAGKMFCLNKDDGKEVWSHDLWEDFGGNVLDHGYSSSPIEYKDTVIALVGGEEQSIVAFKKKDGRVAWKGLSYQNSYSTPRLLEINGELQLVTFMATEMIAVDPANGKLLWEFPHENTWRQNVNQPVVVDGNRLFLSSPEAGARGLKLVKQGDGTKVEEIWSTRKIQFYHVTSVRDGDYVYGSTGTNAPAFMAAVNIKTGEIAWRKRGYGKANVLAADGRLIILDEDGKLYLTSASPEDLTIHSEVELLESVAWTVPTVVGKTMFVRDSNTILALDLS